MLDDADDMMRLQIRLYREEDPKLFAELRAIPSSKKRSRRIRQLLRDALLAEEGVVPKTVAKPESQGSRPLVPDTPAEDQTSSAKSVANYFEQSDFAGRVSIMPGVHFTPRILRVANES